MADSYDTGFMGEYTPAQNLEQGRAIINSLRRLKDIQGQKLGSADWWKSQVSLDTPEDQDLVDAGNDIAIGFTPGLGTLQAGRDFERSRREGSAVGMGLSALGLIPFAGGMTKLVKGAGVGAKIKALRAKPQAPLGFDPVKMRTQYPDSAPPVMEIDKKSGKEFLAKSLSTEAEAVAKARKTAQKDIEAGNYTPYFDLKQRGYVDPANYPLEGNTLTDAMPKKQDTIDKYKQRFDTKDTRNRLTAAYLRAAKDPMAHDWYATGQLEQEYVKELGPKAGRAAYKTDFADGMAATTGGADPTSNMMMAHYGNFLRNAGKALPEKSYNMPFPIGGRYVGNNMKMYDKVINNGENFVAADNPKRFNFSANFQGHRNRGTIDEQMSGGFEPGLQIPPGDSYGVMEKVVHDLAKKQGVPVANFQDVGWAGLKNVDGKPMMQHINEAIERTSRITGLTPEQVLRKNLIRKLGPMFSVAATAGAIAANQDDRN